MIDHISVSSSSFFMRSAWIILSRPRHLRDLIDDADSDGSEMMLVLVSDACSAYSSSAWTFNVVVNSLLRPFECDDA
jgi:hypothetical protein